MCNALPLGFVLNAFQEKSNEDLTPYPVLFMIHDPIFNFQKWITLKNTEMWQFLYF
jgi:hypothetical protein